LNGYKRKNRDNETVSSNDNGIISIRETKCKRNECKKKYDMKYLSFGLINIDIDGG
jgi:hypothetical protein